jgi:opacity protein-like surface antigen
MRALPAPALRFRSFASALALLIQPFTPSAAHAATGPGFQVQADALGAMPSGGDQTTTVKLSDIFDTGPGFAITASFGIRRHWFLAARSGMIRNQGDQAVTGSVVAQPATAGPTRGKAVIFEALVHRKLTTVPTHLVLQYRTKVGSALGVFGEAGAGVLSFTEEAHVTTTLSSTPIELSGRQTSFSWLVGAGLSYPVWHLIEVVAGGDFAQSRTNDGDLWRKGDNPRFLLGTLGIRYPSR